MCRSHKILVIVVSLLFGGALLLWYIAASLNYDLSLNAVTNLGENSEAAELDGKRVLLTGDAATSYGHGSDYLLSMHFHGDWPWTDKRPLYVSPPPGCPLPMDREEVTVCGVLHLHNDPTGGGQFFTLTAESAMPLSTRIAAHAAALSIIGPFTAAVMLGLYSVWKAYRVRRRYIAGVCPVCGYDLRASGERCPECGSKAV